MFQSYANFSRNRFNQPLHRWERRTLKEALEHNPLYTYRSLSIPQFQRWYPLINQTTCHRVMQIFLGTGSVSPCIGGREGGTGAQRSLHVQILLDPMIPAVVSACQSDHTTQSYANLSRIRFNQPLHRLEARRHRSAKFLTRTDSSRSHDSSGAICLSIGPRIAELC